MKACDRKKTLHEIEDITPEDIQRYYDPPATSLITAHQRLLEKPLEDFSTEDLRLMIGQESFLRCLVPLALERLAENPMIQGDYHPGDLLENLLRLPRGFWTDFPDLYYDFLGEVSGLAPVLRRLLQSIDEFERRAGEVALDH